MLLVVEFHLHSTWFIKVDLGKIKRGDEIWIDCDSGFCDGSYKKVTSIQMKFDPDTGEVYNLIRCHDHHFDGRTGLAVTPPLMYFISSK